MSAYTEHAAGIRELMTELGDDCPKIYYRNTSINVLPSSAILGRRLDLGGFTPDSALTFTALLADFPQTPVAQEVFNYPGSTGKKYQIETVDHVPGGLQIRISANDANKGA